MNNNLYYQPPYGAFNYGNPTFAAPNSLQISYVNGLIGAKAYSVPPNTTIFLMDSDAPHFYVKSSDRNGMCTIKAFEFKEMVEGAPTQPIDTSLYVTKEELDAKLAQLLNSIAAKNEPSKPAMPLL